MTISGERTEQLDIFCRVTGFMSDFLSFIDVEIIRFFHGAIQLIVLMQNELLKFYFSLWCGRQWRWNVCPSVEVNRKRDNKYDCQWWLSLCLKNLLCILSSSVRKSAIKWLLWLLFIWNVSIHFVLLRHFNFKLILMLHWRSGHIVCEHLATFYNPALYLW